MNKNISVIAGAGLLLCSSIVSAQATSIAELVTFFLNESAGSKVKKITKPEKPLRTGCKYMYQSFSEGVSIRKMVCEESKTPEFHTKNTQSE